ncbi:MAG: hypothetical protein OEQ13_08340 [Acidobacteriota bacterium]|nr:hypothetical protein [Acidobacteriota bacterium]
MSRGTWLTIVLAMAAVPGLLWLGSADAVSQAAETPVFVMNFPGVQTVRGEVEVRGLGSFGSLFETGALNVTPVKRHVTTRLIDGGVIETEGFSHVVLSLSGEIRGELTRAGTIGAILIPDTEESEKYLKTKGVFLFPEEVVTTLQVGGESVFMAGPRRVVVAFPRYRVLFHNSTDKTVIANLAAYRTK